MIRQAGARKNRQMWSCRFLWERRKYVQVIRKTRGALAHWLEYRQIDVRNGHSTAGRVVRGKKTLATSRLDAAAQGNRQTGEGPLRPKVSKQVVMSKPAATRATAGATTRWCRATSKSSFLGRFQTNRHERALSALPARVRAPPAPILYANQCCCSRRVCREAQRALLAAPAAFVTRRSPDA